MIKHLVFVKFVPDVSRDMKASILEGLDKLRSEIDGLLAFGHGPNLSPEGHVVHGFKDVFWFDFRDFTTQHTYLENETQKATGARIGAAVEGGADGIFACDVELS